MEKKKFKRFVPIDEKVILIKDIKPIDEDIALIKERRRLKDDFINKRKPN